MLVRCPKCKKKNGERANKISEVAGSLVGLFRWCADFLVYLLQEILDISFKIRGKEDDRSYLQKCRKFQNINIHHAIQIN